MLRGQRDDHRRILRALALVDRCRISEHQLVELAETVGNFAAIKVDGEFTFFDANARHDTEIAVVDVKPRLRGEARMIRYIDDFVMCFQYREDALRVQDALCKRLLYRNCSRPA